MQFGFMPGRGTIDAIFIACQLPWKKEKLLLHLLGEVVRWSMRKLNVDEWLIETTVAMYELRNSAVRVNNTVGNKLNVKVGIHQRSVLSPMLIIIVLEAFSREFRSGLPWKMLHADDLLII